MKLLCNAGDTFSQIKRQKSVNTYAGNFRHFTSSNNFLKKLLSTKKKISMTFLFFAFCLHEYSQWSSPPNDKICDPSLHSKFRKRKSTTLCFILFPSLIRDFYSLFYSITFLIFAHV